MACMILTSIFSYGGPDLVVKVIKDDLTNSKKCTLGVLKNGSFKNMDEKYKIMAYDLYVLNYRGETKWYSNLNKAEIDLNNVEDLEIVRGDLIVIDNIRLMHSKSGEEVIVGKITERYLVR